MTAPTKRTTKSPKKHISSPVRHERPNIIVRLLQRVPAKAWWIGGLAVLALYIAFFYYVFVSPYGLRFRAMYGDISYPTGYDIHGIDISHHQGTIDWDELANNATIDNCPLRFIVMKATEGASMVDETFSDNFKQALDHGFIRGAYHFWSNKSSAQEQAAWFIKQVQLVDGDLPPVLDVEKKDDKQSPEAFKESVLTWLRLVEKHYGVKPIIYTYSKFKKQYLSDPVFDQYPYWIAHYYVEKVEYQGPWRFWQHTDVGRLPGIDGFVDLNVYNGSYYDLCKLTLGSDIANDDAGDAATDMNRPMDASKLPDMGKKKQQEEDEENAPLPIKD